MLMLSLGMKPVHAEYQQTLALYIPYLTLPYSMFSRSQASIGQLSVLILEDNSKSAVTTLTADVFHSSAAVPLTTMSNHHNCNTFH